MDEPDPSVSVRRHGPVRELRVGSWCASVYTPGGILTGAYWDLLALPLLLRSFTRPRCLLLGLGAGSGARLLRALADDAHIVGIERSAEVVALARREFDLDELGVDIRIGDAWAELDHGEAVFDLIIEDIFVGDDGIARKPSWLPSPGLERAAARLGPDGVIVSNNLHEAEATAACMRRLFAHVLELATSDADNRVYFGSHAPLEGEVLRSAITRDPLVSPIAGSLVLRQLSR